MRLMRWICIFCWVTYPVMATDIHSYMGIGYVFDKAVFQEVHRSVAPNRFQSGVVQVGMRLGTYIGAEGFYQFSDTPRKSLMNTVTSVRFQAGGGDLTLRIPTRKQIAFWGAFGGGAYRFRAISDTLTVRKTVTGYRFGVGVEWILTPRLSMRMMMRYVDFATKKELIPKHLKEGTFGLYWSF